MLNWSQIQLEFATNVPISMTINAPFTACLLLCVVGSLMGCHEAPLRPNIVLLGVDTLRQDHLGLHGPTRPTTPFLDEMAKRAAVFDANRNF